MEMTLPNDGFFKDLAIGTKYYRKDDICTGDGDRWPTYIKRDATSAWLVSYEKDSDHETMRRLISKINPNLKIFRCPK